MSLSIAHVPMCVPVMYRMLLKSKVSSAPSSDCAKAAFSRASRCSRSLAMSSRFSQSTFMLP